MLVGREPSRIDGTIQHESDRPRPFSSRVAPASRHVPGSWYVHTRAWPIPSLAPGRYTVDVTVDGRAAGSYAFEVE